MSIHSEDRLSLRFLGHCIINIHSHIFIISERTKTLRMLVLSTERITLISVLKWSLRPMSYIALEWKIILIWYSIASMWFEGMQISIWVTRWGVHFKYSILSESWTLRIYGLVVTFKDVSTVFIVMAYKMLRIRLKISHIPKNSMRFWKKKYWVRSTGMMSGLKKWSEQEKLARLQVHDKDWSRQVMWKIDFLHQNWLLQEMCFLCEEETRMRRCLIRCWLECLMDLICMQCGEQIENTTIVVWRW